MGAAASVECERPADASEIRATGSVDVALGEVVRLRKLLGHLAKDAGFAEVVYDGSDLVLGENEMEDFARCVAEVAHIRSALRLATQNSRRRARGTYAVPRMSEHENEEEENEESSQSESEEEN